MTLSVELIKNRYLLKELTKRDFHQKYIGSYLGLLWAVLEPLATTLLLSLVFSYGFKSGSVENIPFFIYMLIGMVAFNFFSTALNEGTQIILNYSYMVKKVDFNTMLLPFVKIFSASLFHLIMLSILFGVLLYNGFSPNMQWFQVGYYFFSMVVLTTGLTLISSAICVFIPDLKNIVSISMQFIFYGSPIFWSIEKIPVEFKPYLKLNPLYYIVNGYRESLVTKHHFWHSPQDMLTFWSTTFIIFLLGIFVFKKLKSQFVDVL